MSRLSIASLLAALVIASLVPSQAAAQGGIACLPMTRGPTYTFEKVIARV